MIEDHLKKVQQASRTLANLDKEKIHTVLYDIAHALEKNIDSILEANKKDLEKMDDTNPMYDRLMLSEERIKTMAHDMRHVADLESPLNLVLEEKTLENKLHLQKISVPLGVIAVIYEARPNVTCDVFALCFKSGNAGVLKGGSDAEHSNKALVEIIHSVLKAHSIDTNCIYLASADREVTKEILHARSYIDVVIPRGGKGLIDFVRENATVPVIETGAGIVHTYFDETADIKKGSEIIFNAKTRRPSVCNALDTLLVHKKRIHDLPELISKCAEKNVVLFADETSFAVLENTYPKELLQHATEEHFGTEFLSLQMSIKVVDSIQDAVEHIATYSSKHSEAIISEDEKNITYFLQNVDAAAVYANASTAFTDGAQFGLGAEIGISTQKLHARGPMALGELTSYKWIARGDGQIRL